MSIRKYITIIVSTILGFSLIFVVTYQFVQSYGSTAHMESFDGNYRFVKIENETIQILSQNENWDNFKFKGIELSSFTPQYSKNKTGISKKQVLEWLEDIYALHINVIKIPSIQPTNFYKAISEFNSDKENPIYTIHEIKLDEKAILEYHDIYNKNLSNNFKKDIKKTVNVIHGKAVLINNKRGYSGIYLNDISKYNLGYILGGNTNPEIITLNNSKYVNDTSHTGQEYTLHNGTAFDVFITKSFDYLTNYELDKYQQISLVSFVNNLETDPLDYKHESNATKEAKIDLNKIISNKYNNIFIAYKYHPNDVDFLDYEYESINGSDDNVSSFYQHLLRLKEFYNKPLLISETGISSSRGVSKLDLLDGYNRGGYSEQEQGQKIVELLSEIDKANVAGFVLNAWQDDWTKKTPFNMIEDHTDVSASSYWQNVLASDESFGLMAFEEENEQAIVIDGDFNDWDSIDYTLDEGIKLKVDSDTDYLYLYLESNQNILNEQLYLGLDITKTSGSSSWRNQGAKFALPVDFILDLNSRNKPKFFVHERYDRFTYLYKYYAHTVGINNNKPELNSDNFLPIYSLNRKQFYYTDQDIIADPIYTEIGVLNKENLRSQEYSALIDYKAKANAVEIRIPFAMINIVNPIDMLAYGDFYEDGLESQIRVKNIGFSLYDKVEDRIYEIADRYKQKSFRSIKYKKRLKESYDIVQNYLEPN